MSTYTIEHAKSGRATCKKCKNKIAKGELRIGTHADLGDDKIMTKWNFVPCFALPRKLSKMPIEEFVDEYLEDKTSDKILDDPLERQKVIDLIGTKVATKKAGGVDSGSAYLKAVKRFAAALLAEDGEDEDAPKKKRVKMEDGDKSKAEAYNKFKDMKISQLQDILSWNQVVKSGTKPVLLTRVIDGYANGRIGRCVACGKGKPKISEDGSVVECNGYFDTDIGSHISCGNKVRVETAPRFKPWFLVEPTEEEEKAMKEEGKSEETDDGKLSDAFVEAANKLDWELTNKANIKKATSDMVKLCSSEKSPIDFPSESPSIKMEVGKMILQNRAKTASEILDMIVEKYGLKEKNEADKKRTSDQVMAMVKVAANGSIFEVLQEFSSIYFSEKNTNAGITYRKVAQAVKDLDFEITAKNAKGLGKGKTKVTNIGKGSAEKIHEFITTGKIQKLEDKRAAQA